MWRFLTIYAGIYGAMLVYVYTLLARAFRLPWRAAAAYGVLAALLLAAPIIGRTLERHEANGPAFGVSLIGYLGMTLVLWLAMAGLALDIWNLLLTGLALAWRPLAAGVVPLRGAVVALLCALAPLLGWGLHEATAVRLRTIHLPSPKLPAGAPAVRVLQLSDLHLGLIVRDSAVRRVLALIREAHPDLLLVTGDLLDSSSATLAPLMAMFKAAEVPGGKFAVLGNHEFYPGVGRCLQLLDAGGFRVLRGEHVQVRCGGSEIAVAGVDYAASRETGAAALTDESAALRGIEPGVFTILLKHQPRVEPASVGHFDLQLSGHTHGGQVFPFHIFVRMYYRWLAGLHHVGAGSTLYISRGAGTWGPPLRLLAPPEMTLFVLDRA